MVTTNLADSITETIQVHSDSVQTIAKLVIPQMYSRVSLWREEAVDVVGEVKTIYGEP